MIDKMKCVNHEFSIRLDGTGLSYSNMCNKCGRCFSKEVMKRVFKQ